jgi:hypothetical protein
MGRAPRRDTNVGPCSIGRKVIDGGNQTSKTQELYNRAGWIDERERTPRQQNYQYGDQLKARNLGPTRVQDWRSLRFNSLASSCRSVNTRTPSAS